MTILTDNKPVRGLTKGWGTVGLNSEDRRRPPLRKIQYIHLIRVWRLLWTHLAPEPEVLDFSFEVSNVGDLRSIFTGMNKEIRNVINT